MTATVI